MQQLLLMLRIQCTGRLIHQAEIGIAQENPCDADSLALSAGKACTHLTHIGLIALRQCLDKLRDTGALCRCSDFFNGSIRFCNGNILGNRCIKQIGVLLQKRNPLMQFRKADLFQRNAVDPDFTFLRRIKPQQQTQNRRFSLSCQVISKKNCRFLQLKENILIASSVLEKDFSFPAPVPAFPFFL